MDYGTGAIYGCPAHDQRDLDFARKYNLDVIPVICPQEEKEETFQIKNEAFIEDGWSSLKPNRNQINADYIENTVNGGRRNPR